eukprot:4815452-Pyramimonas_sp.AAC.1
MAQGGVLATPRKISGTRVFAICPGEWLKSPAITHGPAKLLTDATRALGLPVGPSRESELGGETRAYHHHAAAFQ